MRSKKEAEEDEFECDFCGNTAIGKAAINKHIDKHRNLSCVACNKKYGTSSNLKHHLRSHFDKNFLVMCDYCGKRVSSWKLKRHQETHSDKPVQQALNASYPCRWCGIVFDKLNNRASHEKRIHKTKPNSGLDNFKCTDCLSIFKTRDELRDHSFEHFSGKIHFCDYPGCTRYFKKGKLLTVHKRCHFDPQYKCLDCGQMFIQRPGLIKHQKERCPAKKVKTELPSEEELNRLATLAKNQYINLNGKMFKTPKQYVPKKRRKRNECVEESESDLSEGNNDECETDDKILEGEDNLAKIEIKEEKTELECDDWQYEFLDDAAGECSKIENLFVHVESFENQATEEWTLPKVEAEPDKLQVSVKKGRKPGVQREIKAINLKRSCRFTCDYCGLSDLKSKVKLQKHLNIHRKEYSKRSANTYHCDINQCSEIFTNISSFITHKRIAHGIKVGHRSEKPFVCPIVTCQKTYYSRSSIKSHMEVTHKEIADYNCTQCCRKFKTRSNLLRHFKSVHENLKPFGCEKCGAMFKEKYKLEIHLHNHDEPSECTICGRMVSNMKVHLRHHAAKINNQLVNCPMCEKKIGKYQLLRHIKALHQKEFQTDRSRLNIKVYTCTVCNDYFSRKQELRQHEYLNHSQNSKIYECKICGNVFRKLKLLNVHRFTHQPLNIQCELCNNVYSRRSALWKHQKVHHPEIHINKRMDQELSNNNESK